MDSEVAFSSTKRILRTDRLLEMSCTLTTAFKLEPFPYTIRAAAGELTGGETDSSLEPEEDGEPMHFPALPLCQRNILKSVKVPLHSSVGGWVPGHWKPALIPDVTTDLRYFKGADNAAISPLFWL
jgi:hypothetical protein